MNNKCIHGSYDRSQCKRCIKNKKRELEQNRTLANLSSVGYKYTREYAQKDR